MPVRLWLTAVAVCAATVGCAQPLPNSTESVDALARAVLDAVARRDKGALRRLALDEEEFRRYVWPELPASRPERNTPFSYIWGDLRSKSDAGLRETIAAHGGQAYELETVRFRGETTQYHTFVVHRDSALAVRHRDGHRELLQLFGSVIERHGRFKVFSYVVD